jgi:hypothetical protein
MNFRGFLYRSWLLFAVFHAAGTVASLQARLWLEAGSMTGQAGYRERSTSILLRTPGRNLEDFEQPLFLLRAGRMGRERAGTSGTTFTNFAGAGVEFIRQVSLDVDLWVTPEHSQDAGGYRGRGWRLAADVHNDGWWPKLDIENGPKGGRVQSRWGIFWDQVTHEERILSPLLGLRWTRVGDQVLGGNVQQKIRGTALRASVEKHTYDKNVETLVKRAEFFTLGNARSTAAPELSQGFVDMAVGVGIDRGFGRFWSMSGDYRRASYAAGPAGSSDALRAQLKFQPIQSFWISGAYDTFKPEGARQAEYGGVMFGVGF